MTFGDFAERIGKIFGLIGRLSPDPKVRPEFFPGLAYCLGKFHQDWMFDFDDWHDVLADFLREESKDAIRDAFTDLVRLLSLKLDERTLERLTVAMGCNFLADADSMTTSEWLAQIRDRLRDHLEPWRRSADTPTRG